MKELFDIASEAERQQDKLGNLTAVYSLIIETINTTDQQIKALQYVRDTLVDISSELLELVDDLYQASAENPAPPNQTGVNQGNQ